MSKRFRELMQQFRKKQDWIITELTVEPLPRLRDRILSFLWNDFPLVYDYPRFGAVETSLEERPRGGWQVTLAQDLQQAPSHVLDWVIWREALLSLLLPHLRQISETADLGLYLGLKYGDYSAIEKTELTTLWKQVSPPQHYQYYVYDAPSGFPLFDGVVSGAFLNRVLFWLNTLRPTTTGTPLSTPTYTNALERWMIETHILLTHPEHQILTTLSNVITPLHQSRLAKQLNMSVSGLSQHLTNLAQRHLLRLSKFIDVPLIGLIPLEVFFQATSKKIAQRLSNLISAIRYVFFIQTLQSNTVHCRFLIPQNQRMHFSDWLEKLTRSEGIGNVQAIADSQNINYWNLESYTPEKGWPLDSSLLLNRIESLDSNFVHDQPSPIQYAEYSYDLLKQSDFPLKLQIEDFTYFRRTFDNILLTNRVTSQSSQELRTLGISESMHMRYRRRIKKLERLQISKNNGIILHHVGLNTALLIRIFEPRTVTDYVLKTLHLLPYQNAVVLENGYAYVFAHVTNSQAVDVLSTLRKTFAKNEINASLEARPVWQSYSGLETPVLPKNYDFELGAWKWDDNTLPKLKSKV